MFDFCPKDPYPHQLEAVMENRSIETVDQLRSLYAPAGERSVKKQLASLDPHCIRFLELSAFVVIASADPVGTLDASPRGGVPGFVKVLNNNTLAIPDEAGNNRLDSLENIVRTGKVGLLFLVPGVDETLRINGDARLTQEARLLAPFAENKHPPKLVIEITVREAYLHCAKAFMRSRLWDASRHLDRSVLPSMGEMMRDQIGGDGPAETQADMLTRYAKDL
jgi:uncharacterized protein